MQSVLVLDFFLFTVEHSSNSFLYSPQILLAFEKLGSYAQPFCEGYLAAIGCNLSQSTLK